MKKGVPTHTFSPLHPSRDAAARAAACWGHPSGAWLLPGCQSGHASVETHPSGRIGRRSLTPRCSDDGAQQRIVASACRHIRSSARQRSSEHRRVGLSSHPLVGTSALSSASSRRLVVTSALRHVDARRRIVARCLRVGVARRRMAAQRVIGCRWTSTDVGGHHRVGAQHPAPISAHQLISWSTTHTATRPRGACALA